jgi:hypothetical protein
VTTLIVSEDAAGSDAISHETVGPFVEHVPLPMPTDPIANESGKVVVTLTLVAGAPPCALLFVTVIQVRSRVCTSTDDCRSDMLTATSAVVMLACAVMLALNTSIADAQTTNARRIELVPMKALPAQLGIAARLSQTSVITVNGRSTDFSGSVAV